MTTNNETHKPILALTAPGSVSKETYELLKKQNFSGLVLADGLAIRDEYIDGIRYFYICAQGAIMKKTAKELKKTTKKYLKNQGIENFKVIVLPDGLWPKVL